MSRMTVSASVHVKTPTRHNRRPNKHGKGVRLHDHDGRHSGSQLKQKERHSDGVEVTVTPPLRTIDKFISAIAALKDRAGLAAFIAATSGLQPREMSRGDARRAYGLLLRALETGMMLDLADCTVAARGHSELEELLRRLTDEVRS